MLRIETGATYGDRPRENLIQINARPATSGFPAANDIQTQEAGP